RDNARSFRNRERAKRPSAFSRDHQRSAAADAMRRPLRGNDPPAKSDSCRRQNGIRPTTDRPATRTPVAQNIANRVASVEMSLRESRRRRLHFSSRQNRRGSNRNGTGSRRCCWQARKAGKLRARKRFERRISPAKDNDFQKTSNGASRTGI